MPAPAVVLEDVWLRYRLARQRIPSIKEYAVHWLNGALDWQDLWALRGVTLEVAAGESVGIVGRNGAGKSSLLKVVCGVLRPTRGAVRVRGRVAPILELGTGFDPQLTGVENVRLNALLLGRRRAEVARRLPEIVEFSGLGDFARSPLRTYSTGMVARLAFAALTAWTPDVLILDEFFAVGDAAFAEKCRRRIAELRAEGTTTIQVSHLPETIRATCDRCIWVDDGQVRADGRPESVLPAYEAALGVERAHGPPEA